MCTSKALTLVFLAISLHSSSAQGPSILRRVRECLSKQWPMLCFKEEAFHMVNRTVMSDTPMRLFELVEVEKNPSFIPSTVDNELPKNLYERNRKLDTLLYNKVAEYFESRTVKFPLLSVFEGRKKGRDKMGGYLMVGGLAMMGMMSQLFMGKVAFLAGAALLTAKMALMLAAISSLKKSGGGGGTDVIYADVGGHGGGHGGWHRSLQAPEGQSMAYAAQIPEQPGYH